MTEEESMWNGRSFVHVTLRCTSHLSMAVSIHWTGLLDWTNGLDYWTDVQPSMSIKCYLRRLRERYSSSNAVHFLVSGSDL